MLKIVMWWAGIRYRVHSAIAEWHAVSFQKHWRAASRAELRRRGAAIEKYHSEIKAVEKAGRKDPSRA